LLNFGHSVEKQTAESNPKMACPYCQGDDVERLSDKEQNDLTPGVCGVKKDT
jgi:hypothetical protein